MPRFSLAFLTRRLHLGLATWMVLGSVLAMLPLVVFTAATVHGLAHAQEEEGRARLQRSAELAARAIGREASGAAMLLEGLTVSEAALARDLPGLHREAARLVAANAAFGEIQLVRASGEMVFSTLRPLGVALPAAPMDEADATALRLGGISYSPLRESPLEGERVVVVQVPLRQGMDTRDALRMSLHLPLLGEALQQQQWPADWTAAVVDPALIVIARSRDARHTVGRPASASLRAGILAGADGLFEAQTQEGQRVLTALARVPGTGWVVAVGQPQAALQAQARQAVVGVLAAGLLCTLAGAALAAALARTLGRQARHTVEALQAQDPQRPPQTPAPRPTLRSPVRELAEVSAAFERMHTHLSASEDALHDARHDPLTGLAARALCMERAQALLDGCAAQSPQADCALLYIDLDGFKGVNDRDGHAAGDAVLRRAAGVLREQLRATDVLGRLGGDEFVALFAAPPSQAAQLAPAVAQRMVDGVAALRLAVGCSIGVAVARPGEPLATLLARGDSAMYAAKRAGGRRVISA